MKSNIISIMLESTSQFAESAKLEQAINANQMGQGYGK
jgi:hypothetical protein